MQDTLRLRYCEKNIKISNLQEEFLLAHLYMGELMQVLDFCLLCLVGYQSNKHSFETHLTIRVNSKYNHGHL